MHMSDAQHEMVVGSDTMTTTTGGVDFTMMPRSIRMPEPASNWRKQMRTHWRVRWPALPGQLLQPSRPPVSKFKVWWSAWRVHTRCITDWLTQHGCVLLIALSPFSKLILRALKHLGLSQVCVGDELNDFMHYSRQPKSNRFQFLKKEFGDRRGRATVSSSHTFPSFHEVNKLTNDDPPSQREICVLDVPKVESAEEAGQVRPCTLAPPVGELEPNVFFGKSRGPSLLAPPQCEPAVHRLTCLPNPFVATRPPPTLRDRPRETVTTSALCESEPVLVGCCCCSS